MSRLTKAQMQQVIDEQATCLAIAERRVAACKAVRDQAMAEAMTAGRDITLDARTVIRELNKAVATT